MSLPEAKGPAGTGQSPGPSSTSWEREEGWPSLGGLVPFHPQQAVARGAAAGSTEAAEALWAWEALDFPWQVVGHTWLSAVMGPLARMTHMDRWP